MRLNNLPPRFRKPDIAASLTTPPTLELSQVRSPILVSKTEASARTDLLDLPNDTVAPLCTTLSGGNNSIMPGKVTNFFALLARAELLRSASAVVIGRSLEKKFDEYLLDAIVVAASRSSGRHLDTYRIALSRDAAPLWYVANSVSKEGIALGQWLSSEAVTVSEHVSPGNRVSPKDLEYFFGSGGYRASALIATLRKNFAGRQFHNVVDLGAGIGFISCLVAQHNEFGVRRSVVVEPQHVRVAQGARLWTSIGKRPEEDFEFAQQAMQRVSFHRPVDLAIVCQALFYVPAKELPPVIERVWGALRPGGLFVINEQLTDELSEVRRKEHSVPILRRKELVALLATHSVPRVYQRRDLWACARDPMEISAAELSGDSFLVLEKGH